MEEITRKRLEDNGWYPDRCIDIAPIEKRYEEIGLTMPDNVKSFLRSFGMLEITFRTKTKYTFSVERIDFDPLAASGCITDGDGKWFSRMLQKDYGITAEAYPIGITDDGYVDVLMTKDNVFYCHTHGCLTKYGENIDEMLDCMVGESGKVERIEFKWSVYK